MDLSRYYEQICREPMISKEEEEDLFLELQDIGLPEKRRQQIRDKIIRSHLRFVFKQAKYYSKNDPSLFEELIAAGNEGLLVGIDKFKPSKGVRFLSYAGFWVNQRILKQMSSLRIVSLPIWRQQLAARIQKIVDSRENVTLDDLKKEFPDIPEKDLADLFQTRYLTYYIEDVGEDPAFEINPIETEAEQNLDRERITALLEELPSPHREVIHLFFGIKDGIERNHSEISKELGLSKESLKDIKREALSILRSRLGTDSLV